MSQEVLLAVNGTLMRGLKLNPNMAAAKATFVREAETEPAYRLLERPRRPPSDGARRGRKGREGRGRNLVRAGFGSGEHPP